MFAVVDVGNTTVKMAVIGEGGRVVGDVRAWKAEEDAVFPLVAAAAAGGARKVIMCSVNPPLSAGIEETAAREGIAVAYVDHTNIPLRVRYTPPSAVGSDRLVTAYAVFRRYGVDAVVVDMGTAVTFEFVTREGEYMGGLICPGAELMLRSLHEGTALLPRVEMAAGEEYPLVAQTTEKAVAGGVFWSIACLVPELVRRITESLDPLVPEVFLTGGGAGRFRDVFPREWHVVPDIIIDGLVLLERELGGG